MLAIIGTYRPPKYSHAYNSVNNGIGDLENLNNVVISGYFKKLPNVSFVMMYLKMNFIFCLYVHYIEI